MNGDSSLHQREGGWGVVKGVKGDIRMVTDKNQNAGGEHDYVYSEMDK